MQAAAAAAVTTAGQLPRRPCRPRVRRRWRVRPARPGRPRRPPARAPVPCGCPYPAIATSRGRARAGRCRCQRLCQNMIGLQADHQRRRSSIVSATLLKAKAPASFIPWHLIVGDDPRILDLCDRSLETLYKLPFRSKLEFAILSKNRLFSIAELGKPRFLRFLDVSDNRIDLLPSEEFWSHLSHLQVLAIENHNRFQS